MKTICLDLTDADLAALRSEDQLKFWAGDGTLAKPYARIELPRRITQRITVDRSTGCWLVSGHTTGKGHAKISVANKSRQFHRVVYQLLVGPIPAGHLLDHVKARGCLFRNCGNPDHLEPVTTRENTLRGAGVLHWFQRRQANG